MSTTEKQRFSSTPPTMSLRSGGVLESEVALSVFLDSGATAPLYYTFPHRYESACTALINLYGAP
jgi:hypothetical protein